MTALHLPGRGMALGPVPVVAQVWEPESLTSPHVMRITSISPNPVAGGATVTVRGFGFTADCAPDFDPVATLGSVVIVSENRITFTAPIAADGAYTVGTADETLGTISKQRISLTVAS